jgi:hypothetical protein
MPFASIRTIFAALAALLLLNGCAGGPPLHHFTESGFPFSLPFSIPFFHGPGGPPFGSHPGPYWMGDGGSGAPAIVVRVGEQRAYFYRGNRVVGVTHISTGKRGFDTPPGNYRVIQKDKDHVSTLYGDYVDEGGAVVKANVDVTKDSAPAGARFRGAKMPYFLRFSGGHGLHAGRVPNFPASHGCVRLPAEMARHFYENAPMGTPVRVED